MAADMHATKLVSLAFALVWFLWVLLWLVWARSAKPTEHRESPGYALLHRLPVLFAVLLLIPSREPFGLLCGLFLRNDLRPVAALFGMALTLAGLGLSIWARAILGGNWSSAVEIKQDHALIERGPYALLRHPIYTGLVLAFLGSGIASGEWRGLVAPLVAAFGFWIKLSREERFLTEQFGPAFQTYRVRTFALIPYLL